MSHSDPFGAGAETAAATVAAVATAATVSMASLRASLAELQVELVAHRSEYDDLLRRQAEASPPPSPPQSRPSTPKYFSSTEPARPPPPPRGLVSANTRSATAATSAHAVAAAATAAAATASASPSPSPPLPQVREALTCFVDLHGLPRRTSLKDWAPFCADPAHAAALLSLSGKTPAGKAKFAAEVEAAQRSLVELLTLDYASCKVA